ncbi:uncharacterized protein LOC133172225 [Saccostrea echinata]|uniref:uncharacterized protein LOC133172225 n=1 Tax=Saccostrea echinata TaxID=191078 RepID=UPI002A83714E|nr:uncharacterized protein LOC133172225 [Saccostrea echinata]
MTSSIVYNSVSADLKPGKRNTPEAVFVRYPNNTDFPVDTVVRYTPRVSPVKISFAPDTNFDYRNKSKVAEKVKRSNYNFRPVSEKRRNSLKFQAPASTLPSSTFVTTNKQDYGDTTEHLKRSLRPTPKWFYKSQTSLHEMRPNVSEGQGLESKDVSTNSLSDCGSKNYARSLVLFPSQARAKTLDTLVTNPSSYEYKPLVGDRIILKAQLLREVPNDTAEKDSCAEGVGKVDNRRNTRFSDSLNRYSVCNSDTEYQKKTSKLFSKTSNKPNNRQKATSVQKVTTDMERTYTKQATLRDMIKK